LEKVPPRTPLQKLLNGKDRHSHPKFKEKSQPISPACPLSQTIQTDLHPNFVPSERSAACKPLSVRGLKAESPERKKADIHKGAASEPGGSLREPPLCSPPRRRLNRKNDRREFFLPSIKKRPETGRFFSRLVSRVLYVA